MSKSFERRKGARGDKSRARLARTFSFSKSATEWARSDWSMPLLVALLTFVVYVPSLGSGFVYDGRIEILEEGFITNLANLPAVLSLKVLGMNLLLGDRPGQMLFLMLNAAVWGKEPWGYHLSCNLLHAGNAALLFVFMRRLVAQEIPDGRLRKAWGMEMAMALVVLVFTVHPLAVEPVAAINFSSDLLVLFFTLGALLAATRFDPRNFRVAVLAGCVGTLFAFAAVTSKESGAAAPVLLGVYWFLFRRHEAKGPWFLFLAAAALVTGAFLAARFLIVPAAAVQYHPGYLGGSFSQVFLIQPRLWVFMMGKIIWPTQLSADYTPENVSGITTPMAFAVLGAVVLFQCWLSVRSRIGAMGVAIYWLGLATVSNFMPLNRFLADRFYYLPMAGAVMQLLALVLMTRRSGAVFEVALAACSLAMIPLTLATGIRQRVFSDEFSLWSDAVRVSPTSSAAHNGLGRAFYDRGETNAALDQYQQALGIEPNSYQTNFNVGILLEKTGHLDEAMSYFKKSLAANPTFADAMGDLGDVLMKLGRRDEAIEEFQAALKISPDDVGAHNNLGNVLLQQGHVDEAVGEYQRALAIDPENADAHNGLGDGLLHQGRPDAALAEFRRAEELNPDLADAHYNAGNVFIQEGQLDDAMAEYETALAIKPRYAEAHNNLGIALLKKRLLEDAMVQFRMALDLDPNYASAHNNLGSALLEAGRTAEATTQFQEVLRLNPTDAAARANLARLQGMAQPGAPKK